MFRLFRSSYYVFSLCNSLATTLATQSTSSTATSYASLGDSYAAGDGAGNDLLWCGRFSESYPVQVANHGRLNISPFKFNDLSCGGSTSTSVRQHQVPLIGRSDLITITVGGNEVDFFPVVNECIHQWRPKSSCAEELIRARAAVQASSFIDHYEEMIASTMQRKKKEARLLVTGYAQFFNDNTDQCNHATFSRTDPSNFLNKELRRELNGLVVMLNNVIQSVVTTHGATYVDIDRVFEGHRFCEEGVIEPAPDRPETWFFNIHVPTDEELRQQRYLGLPNPVKDFLDITKTFHPTSRGHTAIANEIVRMVMEDSKVSR